MINVTAGPQYFSLVHINLTYTYRATQPDELIKPDETSSGRALQKDHYQVIMSHSADHIWEG